MNLKDVACEKCKRTIGQRDDKTFFQFGMKFFFDRSGKVCCPFIGCQFEQVFRVNRDAGKSKQLRFAVV